MQMALSSGAQSFVSHSWKVSVSCVGHTVQVCRAAAHNATFHKEPKSLRMTVSSAAGMFQVLLFKESAVVVKVLRKGLSKA